MGRALKRVLTARMYFEGGKGMAKDPLLAFGEQKQKCVDEAKRIRLIGRFDRQQFVGHLKAFRCVFCLFCFPQKGFERDRFRGCLSVTQWSTPKKRGGGEKGALKV